MAKQNSKAELLKDIQSQHRLLEKDMAEIQPADKVISGVNGEWSIKDILAHLTAWEQLFLDWYQAGLTGIPPHIPIPAMDGFNTHQINQEIFEKNRLCSLEKVEIEFTASYQQILALVQSLPDDDIFTSGRFAWTGGHRLADFIAPNTCSHYYWARNLIRKWLQGRQEV